MEPVLIYTDTSKVDAGAIRTFSLDMAFGSDEQNFEASFSVPQLSGGELLYIDGTEYGGIIDSVTQSTETDVTVYKGRTWHGMLAGKVIKPPANQDYYTLSGDANACIRSLLSYVGLSSVLTGRSSSSGITISSYKFDRFTNAYSGLLRMLNSADAVLRIERHDGITELWAEQRATISDEADSDIMDFSITDSYRVPNHLVCTGEGELQDRVVVDIYADASGNVSTTQTLTGVDEIAKVYDYNNADAAELTTKGIAELRKYQQGGGADISVNSRGDWHIGDKLQVRDNRTGTVIVSTIAKKIVKVENGVLTVEYEVGDASAQAYDGGESAETNLVTPIANGGTGATTASGARANLDVPGLSTQNVYTATQSVRDSSIDRDASTIAEDDWATAYFRTQDKDGDVIAVLRNAQRTNGRMDTFLYVYNDDETGESYTDNYIRLSVARDGTRTYAVGDPSAFRNALGINTWGFATGTSDTTCSNSETKVLFTSITTSGCTLSSGGIKVNAAGNYEISGSYEFRTGFNANDICHIIVKNGTTVIAHALWRTYSANPYYTMTLPPFVAQLSANDVVYMYVYNQGGARGIGRATAAQGNGLYVKRLN